MFTLPIAVREMRVMAREPRFFRLRVVAAALLGLLSLAFVNFGGLASPQGKLLFSEMAGRVLAAAAVFGGCSITSDSLSSERREGTLPLIFLTPLHYLDILVGKLLSANLSIAAPLVGGFPLVVLVMTQAGLSIGQLAHMLAGTLLLLASAGCLGLAASSVSLRRRNASSLATMLGLGLWMFVPMAAEVVQRQWPESGWVEVLALFRISTLTSPGGLAIAGGPLAWWKSFFSFFALGLAGLGLAWIGLIRVRVEKPPKVKGLGWRQRWRQWCYGQGPKRAVHRRIALNDNPFYWLSTRDRLRRYLPWGVASFFVGIPIIAFIYTPDVATTYGAQFTWVILTMMVTKLALGSESARAFAEEREQGGFEFVVSTPLSVWEILRGHYRGVLAHLAPMILLVLLGLVWLLGATLLGRGRFGLNGGEVAGFLTAIAILGGWFLTGLASQPLIGAWAAMTVKRVKSANGQSTFVGVLFPFVAMAIGVPIVGLAFVLFGLEPPSQFWSFAFFLAAVVLLTIGADLFWIWFLRRLIPLKFRTWASERYHAKDGGDKPSLLARLLGGAGKSG